MFSILIVGLFVVQLVSADQKARPVLQQILVSKNLKENQTSRLLCALNQGESVRFEWFHSGEKLVANDKRKIRFNDDSSELIIKSTSIDDLGEIKCLARNEYGEDVQSAQLIMNVKPRWIQEPEDNMTGVLFEEISLNCKAKAYPEARYQWIRLDDNQTIVKKYESNTMKFELNRETAGI